MYSQFPEIVRHTIKENPALSHDKTGFKAIRKEKINRFSHGLTYVRPLLGNNIYRPT